MAEWHLPEWQSRTKNIHIKEFQHQCYVAFLFCFVFGGGEKGTTVMFVFL